MNEQLDMETRVELLLANYSAMIQHLHELEKKINHFEEWLNSWR